MPSEKHYRLANASAWFIVCRAMVLGWLAGLFLSTYSPSTFGSASSSRLLSDDESSDNPSEDSSSACCFVSSWIGFNFVGEIAENLEGEGLSVSGD